MKFNSKKWERDYLILVKITAGKKKALNTFHKKRYEGNGIRGRLVPSDEGGQDLFVSDSKLRVKA